MSLAAAERERGLGEIPAFLELCRAGQTDVNGYNLWVQVDAYVDRGSSLDQFGTTREEVRSYLIEDLRGLLDRVRGQSATGDDLFDLVLIDAYFLGEKSTDPIPYEELGTSSEEFRELVRKTQVRFHREELERCRAGEGPTLKFWGLKRSLVDEEVTLEEIDATEEEIDKYETAYLRKHPNSGPWEKSQPK